MIREIVAVGIGGALGSMSRYLVSYVWLVEQSLLGFPAALSRSMPPDRC